MSIDLDGVTDHGTQVVKMSCLPFRSLMFLSDTTLVGAGHELNPRVFQSDGKSNPRHAVLSRKLADQTRAPRSICSIPSQLTGSSALFWCAAGEWEMKGKLDKKVEKEVAEQSSAKAAFAVFQNQVRPPKLCSCMLPPTPQLPSRSLPIFCGTGLSLFLFGFVITTRDAWV